MHIPQVGQDHAINDVKLRRCAAASSFAAATSPFWGSTVAEVRGSAPTDPGALPLLRLPGMLITLPTKAGDDRGGGVEGGECIVTSAGANHPCQVTSASPSAKTRSITSPPDPIAVMRSTQVARSSGPSAARRAPGTPPANPAAPRR